MAAQRHNRQTYVIYVIVRNYATFKFMFLRGVDFRKVK